MKIKDIIKEIKELTILEIPQWINDNPTKATTLIDFLRFTYKARRPNQKIWE